MTFRACTLLQKSLLKCYSIPQREFEISGLGITIISPIGKRGEWESVRDSELFEITEFENARFNCSNIAC